MKKLTSLLTVITLALAPSLSAEEKEDQHQEEEYEELDLATLEKTTSAFIKKNFPEVIPELTKLKKEEPEAHREYLEQFHEFQTEMEELSEEEPRLASEYLKIEQHEVKSMILADKIIRSKDSKTQVALKKQLSELLDKTFELKLQLEETEMKRLQEEIKQIEAVVTKRRENKDKIIERHLDRLIGDLDEDLAW